MEEIIFEEKQYIGFNKSSLLIRIVTAIFCFIAYFMTTDLPEEGNPSQFLFAMGIFTLVLSVILLFILHLKTTVVNNSLILDGFWMSRKVKVELSVFESVEVVNYSKYLLNLPVYNLHRKGKIKFFTGGKDAIKLTDRDGLIYIIGSDRAKELAEKLNEFIKISES